MPLIIELLRTANKEVFTVIKRYFYNRILYILGLYRRPNIFRTTWRRWSDNTHYTLSWRASCGDSFINYLKITIRYQEFTALASISTKKKKKTIVDTSHIHAQSGWQPARVLRVVCWLMTQTRRKDHLGQRQSKFWNPQAKGTQIAKFMGPTWVLSAPDGPHVGPMNLVIRVTISHRRLTGVWWYKRQGTGLLFDGLSPVKQQAITWTKDLFSTDNWKLASV